MSKIKLRQFQELEIHKKMNFAPQNLLNFQKNLNLKSSEIGENEYLVSSKAKKPENST